MPRPYADGLLLTGDSGGFLNGMRLKGIHLAIKSGMLAAETAMDALAAGNSDAATLASFEDAFKKSWAYTELRIARNFHQAFKGGLFAGMLNAGLSMYAGGRAFGFIDRLKGEAGYARMKKITETRAEGRQRAREDRQRADLRQAHRRVQQRDDARRRPSPAPARRGHAASARSAARSNTGTRVSISAPPKSTSRFSKRTGSNGDANTTGVCRSTSATASTVRPATSWTPTRSSPGSRRRAEKVPSTRGCELPPGGASSEKSYSIVSEAWSEKRSSR